MMYVGFYAEDRLYPFFKYDYMLPHACHEARKVVKVQSLSEPLTAERVSGPSHPYSVYGTEIPRITPGSKEFWKSFALDFVEQRGVPNSFPTLTAYKWVAPTASHFKGWVGCKC